MKKILTDTDVALKLQDVVCPETDTILANLDAQAELVGKVKFLSDGPRRTEEFAIVEVAGLRMPLIVKAERLRVLESQPRVRAARSGGNRPRGRSSSC